jgi:uncharacterized LabA/DUF88 family protein
MEAIKKFFHDILTDVDDQSYEVLSIVSVLGVLTFLGLSIYHVLLTHEFDYLAFGGGLGASITGAGAGIAIKENTSKRTKSANDGGEAAT